MYYDAITEAGTNDFYVPEKRIFRNDLPHSLVPGSKIADDPFKHDLIIIDDREGDYERVDFLIAATNGSWKGWRQRDDKTTCRFPAWASRTSSP